MTGTDAQVKPRAARPVWRVIRSTATDVTALTAIALFVLAGVLFVQGLQYNYLDVSLDYSPLGILLLVWYMSFAFLMPKRMRRGRRRPPLTGRAPASRGSSSLS